MKKISTVIVLTFLALLVFFSIFLLFHKQSSISQTYTTSFPIASSSATSVSTVATSTNTAPNSMSIMARGGASEIITNNFLENGITIADTENTGNYYLAGGPGYCLKNGLCPTAAPENNFIITYYAPNQFFTIALTNEPLGAARIAAQQFLITTLGISQNELCNLNYYVGTDDSVNQIYAGKNLLFSFCPDATALP